jgi:dTMP kinase
MHSEEAVNSLSRLIAFEGIDGAGKSTVVSALPPELAGCKLPVVLCAERQSPLSFLLSSNALSSLSPFLKTYLFATDRAWTYEREFLPQFTSGALVLWDRYVDSAIAYRGAELSRTSSPVDIDFVHQINIPFRQPDITFFVSVRPEVATARISKHRPNEPSDAEFLRLVAKQYARLAHLRHYVTVDGERNAQEVVKDIADRIRRTFEDLF